MPGPGQAWKWAEQIDFVFEAFVDAIDGHDKAGNLRETIMEINGDPEGWAKLFAIKCQAEIEEMRKEGN